MTGWSGIYSPVLRHIRNLNLTQQYFLDVWNEVITEPVFTRDNHAIVSNCRPISSLANFLNY
jgi:hypothetical protein